MSLSTPPEPPAPATLAAESKPPASSTTWSVGTLTYTSGGLVALFCWLLFGDFAWSMRDRSVGPLAQWYLHELAVPNIVFGLLMTSFPALVGFVLGPVISVKSDRHRGRWGRRIPFLLVTTPLAAFGMLGLAVTPFIARWAHGHFPDQSEMVISVICFGVFWAAFEFATIASQAVFGGLINDVVPKKFLGRFFGLFRAVSLIDGMIFNYWIIGKAPEHFTLILVAIGIFYGCAFTWVCFKVREGDYPAPPPLDPRARSLATGFFHGAKTYFKECFTSRYYLSVFLMLMVAHLAFAPINTFAIPYSRSLGISMDIYGKFLALTFLISLCLSYFLGWLSDTFHPLRVSLAALLGYVVVSGWGWFNATSQNTFLVAWVAHGVFSGCFFTGAASIGQRLYPHDRFAQFASAAGMVLAPANMALAPLVGLLIDRTGLVYRHTFVVGSLLALTALLLGIGVHRRFIALGGPKNYLAPER